MYRADHVYYHVHNEYPPEERSHGLFTVISLVGLLVLGGQWLTQTGRHHKRPCGQAGPAYKVLAVNIETNMISMAQRLHGLFLNFA
jgi:hypothetical protein